MVKVIPSQKGFTLVEALITCIIIAILVTIAMPIYMKAFEQAQGAKAMENLRLIQAAQALYRTDSATYTSSTASLQSFTNFTINDGNWSYAIPTSGVSGFTATGTRLSGQYTGRWISIDETADIGYSDGADSYPP